jgi:hypothetical protein
LEVSRKPTTAETPILRLEGAIVGHLWAFPITAIGLLLALAAGLSGGTVYWYGGLFEAFSGLAGWRLCGNSWWRSGAAMTLGHVMLPAWNAAARLSCTMSAVCVMPGTSGRKTGPWAKVGIEKTAQWLPSIPILREA